MNVSTKADRAFLEELKRTDPQRYARLARNMEREAGRQAAQRKQDQTQAVTLPKAA